MELLISAFIKGLGIGAGLIIAIGAQNAFVLRQGLKKSYVFTVASISAFCDAFLIVIGVSGLGILITNVPSLIPIATWGGVIFLSFYGFLAFQSAFKPKLLDSEKLPKEQNDFQRIVLTTLTFSLFNPHVYLDTVLLIGSIGGQHQGSERLSFGIGAVLASFIWFFGLAYGAAWLTPLFQRPVSWRILDILVGCTMFIIAISLVLT